MQPISHLGGLEQAGSIASVCECEVQTALKHTKQNQRACCQGIVGEMLAVVLKPVATPPATWKQ
eukprot:9500171-Pyramimonas_sp.AAC.1